MSSIAQSPVDSGYAWIILLASFLAHVIQFGFSYSVGVWYTAFIEEYDIGRQYVALISSLHIASFFAAGPLSSLLTNLYGCRFVCISGALIGCAGVIFSVFAHSVYALYATFGIIAGFGFGLSFVPDIVALGYYFETKRNLAVGIAVSGLGIGNFIFPKIITLLIQNYGLSGALLIVGGLCLNLVAIGALFRPWTGVRGASLEESIHDEENNVQKGNDLESCIDSDPGTDNANIKGDPNGLSHSNSGICQSTRLQDGSRTTINTFSANVKMEKGSYQSLNENRMASCARIASLCDLLQPPSLHRSNMSLRKQCLSKGSHLTLGSQSIVTRSVQSLTHQHIYTQINHTEEVENSETIATQSWIHKLNLDLLMSKGFICLCSNNMLYFLGQSVVYVHLGAYAKETLHLTNSQSANFFSAIGFSSFVGRFAFGALCQLPCFKAMWVYTIGLSSAGVFTLSCPLVDSYWWIMAYAVLFGFFTGSFSPLPDITIQITGLERLSSAYGYILVFEALGSLIGPPLAGLVYDVTGIYKNSFYLGGTFIIIAGLPMIYPLVYSQRGSKDKLEQDPHPNDT